MSDIRGIHTFMTPPPVCDGMTGSLQRGEMVVAPDPFPNRSDRRPFVIVSDETYPFFPDGYLGLPVTTQRGSHALEIHESDIVAEEEPIRVMPSYVNPYSPFQVNEWDKRIVRLSDRFMDLAADIVMSAVGIEDESVGPLANPNL